MLQFLEKLRSRVDIGMVGGSDLVKQRDQLGEKGTTTRTHGVNNAVVPINYARGALVYGQTQHGCYRFHKHQL